MKIFSAPQIRNWDAYTIAHEPVASIDLMERAAATCCKWLLGKNFGHHHFRIFCGKGNNGGDGLAIARMLIEHQCTATVYILEFGNIGTPDFQTNLERLHQCTTDIHFIQSPEFFPALNENDMVIDALFGTGLNKPLEGISRQLVEHTNRSNAFIISIDMPSGLFADKSSKGNSVVNANITLSFQHHKLAFLLPENETCCGEVHLLHIGLSNKFEQEEAALFEFVDNDFVKAFYRPRSIFSHKGTYGHALLVTGSFGMMGASLLSARACLRSGVGKLTCCIPACGYTILQTGAPEAMCSVSGDHFITATGNTDKYQAVGIGPGMGLYASHAEILKTLFRERKGPLVIDADALTILAQNNELLSAIPPGSILTPHIGEFERLFGNSANDFERLELAMKKSKQYQVHIILKGHYSFISTPSGTCYFNSTGNAGMATGGSGDVLTGILTGLRSQGYTSQDCCLLGTYLHGLAGDIAAEKYSPEAMTAGDIINCLADAFRHLAPYPGKSSFIQSYRQ